jgi:uncharacterized membrane protein YhaH (DUF805 family)
VELQQAGLIPRKHQLDQSKKDISVDFMTAVRTCLQKYAVFTGRARRAEYWWFALALFLISAVLTVVDIAMFDGVVEDIGVFSTIFGFATMIPSFAVGARRLHDIDRTGWYQLLSRPSRCPFGLDLQCP